MKKRAVSSLLASLAVVSFILPALATEVPVENEEIPPVIVEEAETEPELESAVYRDGVPQRVDYEFRGGTTYVTLDSFVSMMDPQAVVEEEDGVVTVSSAVVEEVVDD